MALDCGFASLADFSRSFKQHFGAAHTRFDLAAYRHTRRTGFDGIAVHPDGSSRFTSPPAGSNPDGFSVTLRDLPTRTVAYIRVLDPYRPGAAQAACECLMAWAMAQGLADGQWLGVKLQ